MLVNLIVSVMQIAEYQIKYILDVLLTTINAPLHSYKWVQHQYL